MDGPLEVGHQLGRDLAFVDWLLSFGWCSEISWSADDLAVGGDERQCARDEAVDGGVGAVDCVEWYSWWVHEGGGG